MAKYPNEDLFEDTKMTFGEHLEELRTVLVRGMLGLVGGLLIGLLVANQVVEFIKTPLQQALRKHYGQLAELRLSQEYQHVPPSLVEMATRYGFVYEEIFFERQELARLVEASASPKPTAPVNAVVNPATIVDQPLPDPSTDLVKTRIWRPASARMTVLSPHEAFMIWMKAGFVAGLILASPYIFYQIWTFVAAGLYPHEKRYVYFFLPVSLGLFLSGAALAFFFAFGPVLDFLFSFARSMNIDPDLRISEVISFILILPLGFGIAFQLPLVMLLLNRVGILSVSAYLEKWRIAILIIFVISMFLTPADPVSMLLMAVPLTILYFLGVAFCKWLPQGRNPFAEAYEP